MPGYQILGEAEDGNGVRSLSKSERTALFGGDAFSATATLEREDLRIWQQRKAAEAAAKAENGDNKPEEAEDPTFVRPKTPPQGSNHSPWTSYHDLPRSHPVFDYPDDVRQKMYRKGIDPVMKAAYDKQRFGKTYERDTSAKGFGSRLKKTFGHVGRGTLSAIS